MDEIYFRGNGEYRVAVAGDRRPEKIQDGASINRNDEIFRNNGGNWVFTGSVLGGTDGYRFVGPILKREISKGVSTEILEESGDPIGVVDWLDRDLRGPIASAKEYGETFDLSYPQTHDRELRVEPGTYEGGAIQSTVIFDEPRRRLSVVGTPNDPYQTDVSRRNHNLTLLIKDEHALFAGMEWGRTQFSGCGDPYCRDMAFSGRHGKGQSALGGKRACGRFIDCFIGNQTEPDDYAAYYYGGGSVHFDRGNEFVASGNAYIGVNNTVTIYLDGDQTWINGPMEIVEGSGIYPDDLDDGINVIEAGVLR